MVRRSRHRVGLLLAMFLFLLNAPCVAAAKTNTRETPIVKAVRGASASVVNISAEYEIRKQPNPFSGMGMDDFFDNFFKDFFDPYDDGRNRRSSLGSGVIIDGRRGLIITNAHVIAQTGTIRVFLKDQRDFEARIIGVDPDFDLAVLQIESDSPLPELKMGSSDDLMIGETVIAIGNPFGFSHTVTTGVVSALNRSIRTDKRVYRQFIQIDASINPGNSGGPLLNINGELIGINTAIYAKAQGIGFAIPISKAKKIILDLINFGEVVQPWVGISVQTLDNRLARYLKVPVDGGVLIKNVDTGSPAQQGGVLEGDVVISVGSRKIEGAEGFHAAMREHATGDTVSLKVVRDGELKTFRLRAKVFPLQLAEQLAIRRLGIRVSDLTPSKRKQYHISAESGVVITAVQQGAPLAKIGARPGDVIRQIESQTIAGVDGYHNAMVKFRHKSSVIILIQRADRRYYVAVDI